MRKLLDAFNSLSPASKRLAAGGALFTGFFLLYGFTHDRIYAFDSLLYALAIRRPLEGRLFSALLSWNHFLWLPSLGLFFSGLRGAGFTGGPYAALQWWNTGVGALLLLAVYGLLSKFIHRNWALLISCLAGLSHVVWIRSTGGEPYLTGTLLAVAACRLLTDLPSRPGPARLAAIAFLAGLAANIHIANVILLPLAALAIARRQGRESKVNALAVLLLGGLMLLPYVLFYDLATLHGLKEWLAWGSGQVNGQAPGESASGQFDLRFLKIIPAGTYTLLQSFAAIPAGGQFSRLIVLIAAVGAGAWCAVNRVRQTINWPIVLPSLVFFAGLLIFFSVWQPGNLIYWASPFVFFVLSLALLFAARLQSPPGLRAAGAAAVLILCLGVLNFQRAILPNREGKDVKPMVELCGAIKSATLPGGVILISGHYGGFLKVGIPYFAERQAVSLDLAIIQYYGTGRDPVQAVQTILNACLERGIPVYMTDDVLLAKGEFGAWGVPAGRIEALLRSYRLAEVARLSNTEPGVLYRLERIPPGLSKKAVKE